MLHKDAADSLAVKPDRVADCPLQIEAEAVNIRIPEHSPYFAVIETKVLHVDVVFPFYNRFMCVHMKHFCFNDGKIR